MPTEEDSEGWLSLTELCLRFMYAERQKGNHRDHFRHKAKELGEPACMKGQIGKHMAVWVQWLECWAKTWGARVQISTQPRRSLGNLGSATLFQPNISHGVEMD